jgi:hypothetical protein
MNAPTAPVTITITRAEAKALAVCLEIVLREAQRHELTDRGLDALRHKIADAAGLDLGDLL